MGVDYVILSNGSQRVIVHFMVGDISVYSSNIAMDVLLTTNRNEQAHRNINRDGGGLTLLGGLMRRFHYGENLTASLDIFGISSSDHLSTHTHRAKRALSRRLRYNTRLSHDTAVVDSDMMQHNVSCARPSQAYSTVLLLEPQLEHDSETIPSPKVVVTLALASDSPLMPSSGVIPVSTFNSLTFAMTLGEHVPEYRSRSPLFSVTLPMLPILPLHPPLLEINSVLLVL
ncbi:hypothetical protein AZE42_12484 [Rhizopogon vesiculosus]|uniref:Uncharacterized protein n=1 Tax=Rhizopogon vesiculosus TaxID=180088 RepID=A0A1J8PSC1_9AGAM|nr:hypothetical protein AZE42_12484 [Rhizopogon vesiculosus]